MSAVNRVSATEPRTSFLRLALVVSVATVVFTYFGPGFVSAFRPRPAMYPDFVQEWLSARNYWSGEPVYSPQYEALLRHTGHDIPAFSYELPWNAHPPVSVLVALPFGLFTNYATAHLAWNLVTFLLFVFSLVLLARELGIVRSKEAIIVMAALVISWNAVLSHIFQGQLNFVILFLLVVAWVANHRGYQSACGLAVGAAVAMKIFPALLLVYFAATGRWRAVVVTLLTAALLNAVSLAVLGPTAFETYIREVLPSLDRFQGAWSNVSLTGHWKRVGAALGVPAIGATIALVCQLAVVAAVAWVSRRARTTGEDERAFALTVVGMLLASPIAWTHYFVLLPIPLTFLWQRLSGNLARAALVGIAVVLWLPEKFVASRFVPPGTEWGRSSLDPIPGGVDMVVGLGGFTYAMTALFLLIALARLAPAPAPEPTPALAPLPAPVTP